MQLNQLPIFQPIPRKQFSKARRPNNRDLIRSVSGNQHEILLWIQQLYGIKRFDLDTTYSKGRFYRKGVRAPRFKMDIIHRENISVQASAAAIPFKDCSFGSVVFDPPFFAVSGKKGNIRYRYGAFESLRDLWETYQSALRESWRILRPQGYLIFKCQDMIHGRQQFMIHTDIIQFANSINFYCLDLFIKTNSHALIGWNHNNQNHARKTHCYFLVFQKKIRKVRGIIL